jgi:hypothetical protein
MAHLVCHSLDRHALLCDSVRFQLLRCESAEKCASCMPDVETNTTLLCLANDISPSEELCNGVRSQDTVPEEMVLESRARN